MKKLLLFLAPIALFALVSGDEDYFYKTYPFGTIIYAKSAENEAARAAALWQATQNGYDGSFSHKLNRPILALAGNQNQIANAYATSAPRLKALFYGAGAEQIDYFGASDWTAELIAHEVAHLYQLDAKGGFPNFLETVFGRNTVPILAGIVPFWTYPNAFMPDLFLEGNAVFNESRLTGEGRLYGGRHKALFLALLKAEKLDARGLINNRREFPYLEEKYIVGGFFQAWLAAKYGADKTNSFFAENGNRWINPFLLNKSLNRRFGASYEALIDSFLQSYEREAKAFTHQAGELVARTKIYAPLGGDDAAIYVYSSDGETSGDLIRYDRQTRKTEKIAGSFLAGRPFFGDFGYATVSSGYTARDRIETGLFDKNRNPIDAFNGQILQDLRFGSRLYFQTSASFSRAILYENTRKIAPVVSNARFGADGRVYSVRAKNGGRAFYAGEEELFELETQATLCDVLPQGSVLFAAPSANGNGLFLWQKGRVIRLGKADDVLDARFVSGEDFLVTSVTSEGFETRLTTFSAALESPVKPQTVTPNLVKSAAPLPAAEARSYGELRNIGLTNVYPYVGYDSENGAVGQIEAYFSDPLEFNSLSIVAAKGENAYGYATYDNRRHLIFWGGGVYGEDDEKIGSERDFGAEVYVGYLLKRSPNDRATLTVSKRFDPDDKKNEPIIAALEYDYAIAHPYAYKSARSARLAVFARTGAREKREEQAYKIALSAGARLFWQTYIEAGASYAKSNDYWIAARKDAPFPIDPIDYDLRNLPQGYRSDRAIDYYGELSARIDTPLYGLTLPLGLKSIAPLARYERLELGQTRFTIEEITYALQAELLLAHRIDLRVESGVVQNDLAKNDRYYFTVKTAF